MKFNKKITISNVVSANLKGVYPDTVIDSLAGKKASDVISGSRVFNKSKHARDAVIQDAEQIVMGSSVVLFLTLDRNVATPDFQKTADVVRVIPAPNAKPITIGA